MGEPKNEIEKPIVIGWRERVDLPDWGIETMEAKADTGACNSAIDVANLRELANDRVRFDVVLSRRDRSKRIEVIAPIARKASVKSSNGQKHDRYFVETQVQIGPVKKTIELSLVNRRHMVCRMLLGRSALAEDFLVDANHVHLFSEGESKAGFRMHKHDEKSARTKAKKGETE